MSKDQYGVQSPSEVSRQIFCNVRSVSAAEYFTAGQQGYRPEFSIAILAEEYEGEQLVEYREKRYNLIRTYRRSEDILELDVEERSGGSGGNSNSSAGSAENSGSAAG